jgi:uncharacterized protein (TIGR02246 family)
MNFLPAAAVLAGGKKPACARRFKLLRFFRRNRMQRLFLIPLVPLVLLLTGCSQAPPPASDTREADVKAIQADGEQWQKDFAAKDGDKLASHYTDDVVVMNPGQPLIKGKEAARANLKPMLSDPAFKLTFEIGKVEVARSGDIGYATGPYRLTYTDPVSKKVIDDKGNYVEVYKKQADGSWKSAYDITASEVLSAPSPPAKKK